MKEKREFKKMINKMEDAAHCYRLGEFMFTFLTLLDSVMSNPQFVAGETQDSHSQTT